MAEDIGVAGEPRHDLLALQVVGHIKDKGHHGPCQHVLRHQDIPGKTHVVRGDEADMVRGVPRGAHHLEGNPTEHQLRLPKCDDPVHRAHQVLQPGNGADHPHGKIKQVIFQALLTADDVRLQLGQAGFGAIGFTKIAGGLMVVVVHVGAQNPHRGQAGLGQGRLNLPLELGAAGVQQQAGALVDLVEPHQLGALQHPGVSFHMDSFHGVSPGLFCRSSAIIKAATSAGETPEIRAAWPRFPGRMASSFCRASRRRPASWW